MDTVPSAEAHAAAHTTVAATPYAWPWNGAVDPSRLALVVLRQGRWQPAGAGVDELLGALAAAVCSAGGIVVVVGSGRLALLPFAADAVVSTDAASAFYGTGLDGLLRAAGRTDLLLAGWGLEGPVHSTMRAANDRGYECLLVEDASGAADPALTRAAFSMVMHSGGIFGAHAPADAVLTALAAAPPRPRSTRSTP